MNIDNDVVLVDKPAGWTSFDVVAKIRGALRLYNDGKKSKVGHAGTLDPFATGLLVILVGDACKQADSYLKQDKTYTFTALLGVTSTTGDPEGVIEKKQTFQPSKVEVDKVIAKLTGVIMQTPPAYSAIKVNGQRSYTLARKGQAVELKTRPVNIKRLEVASYAYPELKGVCEVSSGTYIRSLVEDIGKELGTGAYCSALRRTQIGSFKVEDAQTPEQYVKMLI